MNAGAAERTMVGAIRILVIFLVLYVNQCLSSSTYIAALNASYSPSKTREVSPTIPLRPRRMLGPRRSSGHGSESKLQVVCNGNAATKGAINANTTRSLHTWGSRNLPQDRPSHRRHARQCRSCSRLHPDQNSTILGTSYGAEKRTVPTGSNPLHN
ncbi:hypothetical protein KP509_22G036500 [Ceratopteris richardii]|uniref:Uncharacterized protein n=1 Tax=Ceratopteris richardii TaxID=49495 RepID=A0A8T2S460_CERRI|nr:hypothetical protein KP509_22G036500 [Ceratopteris richardii]